MKIDNVDNAALVSQLRARLPKEAFVNISDYQILLMYLMLRKDINETIKSDTLQAMKAAMVFVHNLHENRHIKPSLKEHKLSRLEDILNAGAKTSSGHSSHRFAKVEPKAIPKKKKLTDQEYAMKCVVEAQKRNLPLAYVCKVIAERGREVDLTDPDYVQLANNSPFSFNQIKDAFAPMQIVWPKRR